MNDLTNEMTVTTKELSEALNVPKQTIANTVVRLDKVLGRVSKNSQGGYLFTEKQATLIKQEIQRHHNLQSRQIDSVSTDYEMEMLTQKVIAYHVQKANEYKQRAEIAEKTLNRIADSKGCFTMNTTAKALKLPYGNIKLYELLRGIGVLNSDNSPKQDQINAGHFTVVVKHINDLVGNKSVTLTTSKGLVYLAKKLGTEIDESVMPDC